MNLNVHCSTVYSSQDIEAVYQQRNGERRWSESESHSVVSLCDPMDYTVHGILQARILEPVAIPFSYGSSQPRDQIQVSCIAGRFFTSRVTREAQEYWNG